MTLNARHAAADARGQADQIGARIGADPAQTQQAISAALPALLAGLQQQATPGSGLQQAIEQDHDGSILDDLSGYLNGTANLDPRTTDGQGILDHVLGDQQAAGGARAELADRPQLVDDHAAAAAPRADRDGHARASRPGQARIRAPAVASATSGASSAASRAGSGPAAPQAPAASATCSAVDPGRQPEALIRGVCRRPRGGRRSSGGGVGDDAAVAELDHAVGEVDQRRDRGSPRSRSRPRSGSRAGGGPSRRGPSGSRAGPSARPRGGATAGSRGLARSRRAAARRRRARGAGASPGRRARRARAAPATRRSRSRGSARTRRSGTSTFSAADRIGIRPNAWNTNPMFCAAERDQLRLGHLGDDEPVDRARSRASAGRGRRPARGTSSCRSRSGRAARPAGPARSAGSRRGRAWTAPPGIS